MSTATLAPTGTWKIDPAHTRVGFSVKHMGISTARGEFESFDGTLEIGDDLTTSRVLGTVDVASVNTKEAARDEHLRSADFFDAEHHPQITFASTAIEPAGDDRVTITGELTIRGVTNVETFEAEIHGTDTDPWGGERVGLEVRGEISRAAYGIRFNQALGSGNALVGDRVRIALDIEAVKVPA